MDHPRLIVLLHASDDHGTYETLHEVEPGETVEHLALRLMTSVTKIRDTVRYNYWHGRKIELRWVQAAPKEE